MEQELKLMTLLKHDAVLPRDALSRFPADVLPVVTPLVGYMVANMRTVGELRRRCETLDKLYSKLSGGGRQLLLPPAPRDIRELRRALRLSQKTLGNFAGVTRFSVSYWEHDRTHPSSTSRRVIFHVLETGRSSLRRLLDAATCMCMTLRCAPPPAG